MKKKYYIFLSFIFLLIIIFYVIQTFYIEPNHKKRVDEVLKNQYESYIVYKNSHRSYRLYLSDKKYTIKLSENETWNKPEVNDSLNNIIIPSNELYKFSRIGDKIFKIE
ncbi:MAG: hypothetical protein RSD53_06810, partial [Algoriella sp.]